VTFSQVAVLGLGKVGHLAATFLHQAGFEVTGIDQRVPATASSFPVQVADVGDVVALDHLLETQQAVLSCLPYHLNREVARLAHARGRSEAHEAGLHLVRGGQVRGNEGEVILARDLEEAEGHHRGGNFSFLEAPQKKEASARRVKTRCTRSCRSMD
jgi:3-hydroxyacyl-CoA dehydrogenase